MIFESIIELFVDFAISSLGGIFVLDGLTEFIVNLESLSEFFFGIISSVFYFLPVNYLAPLFILVFAFMTLRILIALLKLFIDVVPLW